MSKPITHCGDLARLRSHSCIIDGEAIACDDIGMPSFDRILLSGLFARFSAFQCADVRMIRQKSLKHRDKIIALIATR